MKKQTRLLSILLALALLVSALATASVVAAEEDPDAKPLVDWSYSLATTDEFWAVGLAPSATLENVDHYAPIGGVSGYYKGPVNGWEALHYGGLGFKHSYNSLNQFDGVCFYINISEEDAFTAPAARVAVGSVTYAANVEVLEKGTEYLTFYGRHQTDGGCFRRKVGLSNEL